MLMYENRRLATLTNNCSGSLINKRYVHEKFSNTSDFDSDIALVRLQTPVRYTREIGPICVPRDPIPLHKSRLEIAGWGATTHGIFSQVLLRNTVFEYKYNCQNMMPFFRYESQICAVGRNGEDPCKGDSGGPLMITLNIQYQMHVFLAGIISYGSGNCGDNLPGVYTKTGAFFSWISANLKP
ncbi:GM23546 [Drosophila sechellia]|uniref:GM23546 n=2 Tax=Drosophila sechellia TaxID=7238 RepID=B4HFX5_DROSE|nr:GM23546 [Drosophila sechellia]